jgi:ubiquinone/menaquinone biosynthesis C-methylase UbiE
VSEAATHREVTRSEFARQAANFEQPGSIFKNEEILDWIRRPLQLSKESIVLDVAGGTGQLGRRLAREAALAIVVDLTPEMLERGALSAREQGTQNVVFLEGDATALPFAAEQFDLVVSRFALHHMDDPARAINEMSRVCRRGGSVVLIDMVREPGEHGKRHDELERLRDRSHRSALTETELSRAMGAAELDMSVLGEREQRMGLRPWLDQAGPSPQARAFLEDALAAEADGGPATGLHGTRDASGEVTLAQRWLMLGGARGGDGLSRKV